MLDAIPQIIVNGIIAGSLYALLAIGLGMTYGILGFVNFAHAEMAMVGGYLFYFGYMTLGWPLIPSIMFAIPVTIVIGYIIQKTTFDPVRTRSVFTALLASVGVAILLQNIVLLIAGGADKALPRIGHSVELFGGARITQPQIAAIASSIIVILLLFAFLKKTKTGKAIRAVADNPQGAAIVGINVQRIVTIIFAIGTGLAAFSGFFLGYESSLYPFMGIPLIIKAFVAVIIGGVGNIRGIIGGAYVLGLIENLAIGIPIFGFWIPAGYKDAIAFIILVLLLFFRPEGLFGTKSEEAIRKT